MFFQQGVGGIGAALPGSPTIGDRYILTTDGKIYLCTVTGTPGTWISYVPETGWEVFVAGSNDCWYTYTGVADGWQKLVGMQRPPVIEVTGAAYAMKQWDKFVIVTTDHDVTLPVPTIGGHYYIRNESGADIDILQNGAETIEGNASLTLGNNGDGAGTLYGVHLSFYDGDWKIISNCIEAT